MPMPSAAVTRLAAIPGLTVISDALLAPRTRFQIGGPAAVLCETRDAAAFVKALIAAQRLALPRLVIGGGTNLVVSDAGFDGVTLRYMGSRISQDGSLLRVEAG